MNVIKLTLYQFVCLSVGDTLILVSTSLSIHLGKEIQTADGHWMVVSQNALSDLGGLIGIKTNTCTSYIILYHEIKASDAEHIYIILKTRL